MKKYAYRIVNVFARAGRLTGNPLCVFEDGSGIADADMQALARQFNLSETTFILPSEKATARVRIFTPSYEMPFAGHPTLGTAHVVRDLKQAGDELTLEMKAGVIPVSANVDRWTLQANTPRGRAVPHSRSELAEMLGLDEKDIGEWPLWISAGREQLMVPLRTRESVGRARPKPDVFTRLKSEDGQSQAYVFHDDGKSVEARFFFPNGSAIIEDPATGSACANLGGWFSVIEPRSPIKRTVSQGEAVQRPSTLYLDVEWDASNPRIFVGGDVIELGRGTLKL
ncbi:MAG TPA: PhzF family phenazine biosynthesis protein [Usitatibacter sp.]|nr:PhzF family phenazine biosynthesis protein [Usitatibacter sp.]